MGCYKEISLRLQELQEQRNAVPAREDDSYPSPVRQLLCRLEDWKEYLRERIETQRKWEATYFGAPRSDPEAQYRTWPDYLPARDPEGFHVFPPGADMRIDEVMEAIAALHERLLLYGCDAEAEEARRDEFAADRPLNGQLVLPFAA